jgi:GNAT superfamily N-acetyltransferase
MRHFGEYRVRLADPVFDWDALSWLRAAVEARLVRMHEQAGDVLPTDLARGLDRMAGYAGRDQMYLVLHGQSLIACHALTPDGDPAFWTPGELGQEALYLDNAMVHPARAHMGVGALITRHAHREARDRGMDFVRLDCQRGNPGLRSHWENLGFTHLRDAVVPGRASGTLMEAKVSACEAP